MIEMYAEAGAKRKEDAVTLLKRFGLILLVIVGLAMNMLNVNGVIRTILMFASFGVFLYVWYAFPKLRIEYEYIFCDGQFDVDKILGNAKRKNILKVDFEKLEVVAPKNSHELDSFNNSQILSKDFTSHNPDAKVYTMVIAKDNKLMKIHFEPTEKMLTCMKNKAPRKVYTN